MAYILGYIVADGCITVDKSRRNPFTLNITSKDETHLYKIRAALVSEHRIGKKLNSRGDVAFQLQARNQVIANDLMGLGIAPRKTHNLQPLAVPDEYFLHFVRGFFDGDGSVYIYNVNNTPQIKSGFVCASFPFLEDFNNRLCVKLSIPEKSVCIEKPQERSTKYSISFYIDDCEKLANFMYEHSSSLYLERKYKIFEKWKSVKRRNYTKQNYPSKVGWRLNQKISVVE